MSLARAICGRAEGCPGKSGDGHVWRGHAERASEGGRERARKGGREGGSEREMHIHMKIYRQSMQ